MKNLANAYTGKLKLIALNRLNTLTWWALAIAAFVLARGVQYWLDAAYAASQFPVPFFVGQTTFDASELKGYFQHLLEQQTLGLFIKTQMIDYIFMLATFVSFFCFSSAVMRTVKVVFSSGWIVSVALVFVWLSPLAAVMDAFENLVSFIMLAQPLTFPDWLVYPYSSFAVLKFAIFGTTYLWALLALVACVLTLVYRLLIVSISPGRVQ